MGTVTSYPLGAAGDVAPEATLAKDMNGPSALSFDSSGNLWVANSGNDTVLEFTKGELAQAHAAPSVTISSDASHDLNGPDGLAFGPAGDLWVASSGTNMLIEYTKAELAKSGSPTPRAIVPAPASATTSPAPDGLALDPSGDLWVTSSDGGATGTPTFNVVAEFTKAELAKAHPVPSVTISSDASRSLVLPGIPVFAPSGALWVPNATNNTVVEYTRSELTKSGSPAPYLTISANASLSNLNEPGSLAFDRSGDLWVVNASTVVEFNKGQLTKSGSPAPMRTIAGPKTGLNCPSSIVVQP
jgi:secreted PhoX family phosphatase